MLHDIPGVSGILIWIQFDRPILPDQPNKQIIWRHLFQAWCYQDSRILVKSTLIINISDPVIIEHIQIKK